MVGKGVARGVCVLCVALAATDARADWYKGNTHCHTEVSPDSESPMEELMAWYKDHDYDFVVLTDHNAYTTEERLNELTAAGSDAPLVDDTFILIPGEELTTSEHHVNGLDMPAYYAPGTTISASFEIVWAAGGFPQLNHPEWNYLEARYVAEELAELSGPMFLEVFNSHPGVEERSGPSSEDFWDELLSSGQRIWGVAVDDAHTLSGGGTPPGGGYIYVDAEELTTPAILSAMQAGRFYASSGATLADFRWTSEVYEVDAPGATSILFFGANGAVLERVDGDFASYRFRGDELYVRARVESPDGFAWTQPLFVGERPENLAPRAQIVADPLDGDAPLRVRLDGSGSTDADGVVESWRWDFGDGEQGRGPVIVHTYDAPGRYEVELTVFDDDVALGRDVVFVEVRDPDAGPAPTADTGGGAADTGAAVEEDAEAPDGGSPPVAQAASSGDGGCAVATSGRIPAWPLVLWGCASVVLAWRRRRYGRYSGSRRVVGVVTGVGEGPPRAGGERQGGDERRGRAAEGAPRRAHGV